MIPPQEAVEAGARVVWEGAGRSGWEIQSPLVQHDIRERVLEVLTAATPHILESALADLETQILAARWPSGDTFTGVTRKVAELVAVHVRKEILG